MADIAVRHEGVYISGLGVPPSDFYIRKEEILPGLWHIPPRGGPGGDLPFYYDSIGLKPYECSGPFHSRKGAYWDLSLGVQPPWIVIVGQVSTELCQLLVSPNSMVT